MATLIDVPKTFLKGIAHSRVSLLGAMAVTASFPFLLGALLYDMIWHIDNPYFSALIYMVLGPVFLGGLGAIFAGLFFLKGKEDIKLFTLSYLRDKLSDEKSFEKIRKLVFLGVLLTCINIFVFAVLGYSGYHYMESTSFCGQFCHKPMNPEFTAYKNSPHSRVTCVECHIGSGATWFVKSKISGVRQLFAVVAETYSRPIETPIHGLRPARDTCEQCHRPEKFHGDKLVVKDKYLEDEKNTHVQTVLLMKIGSAGDQTEASHGIHWHVAPENEITYKSTDRKRDIIPEVMQRKENGTQVVYKSEGADESIAAAEHYEERPMDCIDCHNRPSHIYLGPAQAVDGKLLTGDIPIELPFIKKKAMELITVEYASQEEALTAIATGLTAYYKTEHADLYTNKRTIVEKGIEGVQTAYANNVFPDMGLQWNTYPSNLGHTNETGCFRCHDEEHESEEGDVISMDCDTCHTILAEEEENPEILQKLLGDN